MMATWLCTTEEATIAAGREIARMLPADAVVHLVGDLGSGKTFLARAMAAALGADPRDVASPSFAIVHEYPRPSGPPSPKKPKMTRSSGPALSAIQRSALRMFSCVAA